MPPTSRKAPDMETTRLELKVELPPLLRELERLHTAGGDRSLVLATVERSACGVVVLAGERVLAVNRAAERMWSGRQRAESSAESRGFYVMDEDGRRSDIATWALALRDATEEGSADPRIERILIERRDGSRAAILGGCGSVRDGEGDLLVCIFGEPRPSKEAAESAQVTHHRVSLLAQATAQLLSSSLDPGELLQQLARLLVPAYADGCSIYLIDEATGEARCVADLWGKPETGQRLRRAEEASRAQPRWLSRIIRTGVAELYPSLSEPMLRAVAADPEHLDKVREAGVASVMLAPLRSRQRVIGALAVASTDHGRAYEPADVDMLEQLAVSAGLAVENARLYRDEQHAREGALAVASRLTRLQEVMRKLAYALTPSEVARVLVEEPLTPDATMGGIWKLDEGRQELRLLYTSHHGVAAPFQSFPVQPDSVVFRTLSRKEPVFVGSRAEIKERYPASAWRFADAQAIACCPVLEDDCVDCVLLFTFGRERAFSLDERAFFAVLVEHGAEAMRRARAYEAEQRARLEMSLLYDLLDTVNRAATIDEVCERALDVVERAMGVTRSAILFLDDEGMMRFRVTRGLSEDYRAADRLALWPPDVRDPSPIVVSDAETDPRVERYREQLRREGVHALAFVPLVHEGALLGNFVVYSSEHRTFSYDEVSLAKTIGAQVAQAVVRKRQAAEVEAARAEAEHANRMKDEFLAVVSHELRTPLSAILGWSALLQTTRRDDPATLSKALDVIARNAKAQATIIDDILDMSRVIRGQLVLDAHPVALTPIIAETIESLKTSAAAKQIELGLEVGCDDCVLVGDTERLRQIAWNLLSNAVKFTPPGGAIHARLRREDASIVLEVEDTGSGIEPDVLPFVFDRFRQADSSPTRRAGGLGLGLAIVRQLVELHGGNVTARSGGSGKGSTFTVTFPIRALVSAPRPDPPATPGERPKRKPSSKKRPDLRGTRVLVVDDEADAREVVREALVSYGAVVEVAGTSRGALELLPDFHPSVLVLDIGMPEEDGYTLLRRVRALPEDLGDVPALAMTAYARDEDVARARAAGFASHLAKPAHPDDLARAIATVLRSHRAAGRASGGRVNGPARSSGRSSRTR